MAITVELTEGERRLTVAALKRARNRNLAMVKGDAHKEEAIRNQYNKMMEKFKIND